MKFSKTRLIFISIFFALLLTTIACATLIGPDNDVTSVPVLTEPTDAASNDLDKSSDPGDSVEPDSPTPAPPPSDEPTPPDNSTQPEQVVEITPPADLGDLFAPFWEVWEIVHEDFVDQPLDNNAMMLGAIDGVTLLSEIVDDSDGSPTPVSDDVARSFALASSTPDELQELFLPFWKTWVQAKAPKDELLMRAAIYGMLESLGDQHTSYMDPDQFVQANIPLDGEYEGIGAWVDPDGEYLTIVSPMPGSPAEEAGLQPGDEIIKVDGEDMTGTDGNLVIRRVLGPAGTQVTLTIRREGVPDLFDVTITRGRITIPSVTGEMLEEGIAYVQLFNFGDNTADDLRETLIDLSTQNPKGLILDLRNNGGGFLRTAIEVASEFIGEGVVMYEVYGDGTRDAFEALRGGVATEIPMVVLINEGSASASEILAGAIQDHGRGLLVGVTSFGKGSVQNWIALKSEPGAVRVTIARWYTPNERLIHGVGLEPDVYVEITEEDFSAGIDPQLDKAIELLANP